MMVPRRFNDSSMSQKIFLKTRWSRFILGFYIFRSNKNFELLTLLALPFRVSNYFTLWNWRNWKARKEKFTNWGKKKRNKKGTTDTIKPIFDQVRYRWINKPEWQSRFVEFKNSRPCLPRTGGRLISLSRHVNARRCNLEKVRPVFFFFPYTFSCGKERGHRRFFSPFVDSISTKEANAFIYVYTRLVIQFLEERSRNGTRTCSINPEPNDSIP